MLQRLTKSETLSGNDETPFQRVTVNGIPYWRDASTGRTFPQFAGGSDESTSDGDASGGENTDERADDDDTDDSDVDRLRKRNEALKRGEKNLRDALRTQRRELEGLKAKEQERADADKSELEKAHIKLAAAEKALVERAEKLKRTLIAQAIERAATKHNARDPEVIAKLIDLDALMLDDQGAPTNADDLVKSLLKEKQYLVNSEQPTANGNSGVPPTPRSSGAPGHADKQKIAEAKLVESGDYRL